MEQIGPYRVLEELGRGGMGVVYRGQDVRDGRPVALKVLLDPAANLELLERFRREVYALRGVEHPNLVRVLDLSLQPPCAVFEYVAGGTLKARVEREGPLPWPTAAQLVGEVAEGVAAVHERGLLHRDIKPENVLLDAGGAKLGDFGLVKDLAQSTLTQSGATLGTPGFMAPEQIGSEKDRWSEATDVYGLAATLYFALTGVPPFRGAPYQILRAVLEEAPVPPQVHAPGIPAWLNAAVVRGLAKQGQDRFPSALAFRAALLSEPEPAPRRRWAPALLAVVLTLAALGVAALALRPRTRAGPAPGPVGLADDPRELGERVARGRAKVARGDHAGALVDFDEVLAREPNFVPALVGRAVARFNLGRFELARSDCDRALTASPSLVGGTRDLSADAYRCRALASVALGEPGRALADCDRVVDLQPDSGAPYRTRAWTKLKLAQRGEQGSEGMLEDAQRGVELSPDDADAYATRGTILLYEGGRDAEAIADFDAALQRDPNYAQAYAGRGKLRAIQGALEAALQDLDRALELAPTAEVYADRASVHLQRGAPREALADLNRELELEPGYLPAYRKRAQVHAQLGDARSALADLDEVVTHAPDAGVYAQRALLRMRSGQPLEHALDDVERSLDLDATVGSVHGLRGQLLSELGRDREALPAFDRALELGVPDAAFTHTLRAASLAEVGRFSDAVQDFTEAITLAPERRSAYQGRGAALFDLGRFADALRDFEAGLAIAPNDPNLHEEAAQACLALRDQDRGLAHLDRALQLDPTRGPAYGLRGTVYASRGRHDLALPDLDRALGLMPETAQLLGYRATSRRSLGDRRGALEDCERALQLGDLAPGQAATLEALSAELRRELER